MVVEDSWNDIGTELGAFTHRTIEGHDAVGMEWNGWMIPWEVRLSYHCTNNPWLVGMNFGFQDGHDSSILEHASPR